VDGLHLAAQVDRVDAADDAEVRTAGFDSFSQPAVLVSGALTPGGDDLAALPSSPRVRGRAVIVLQSERVLTVLLRGVRGVREGGGR
jgi:hypothetical protein